VRPAGRLRARRRHGAARASDRNLPDAGARWSLHRFRCARAARSYRRHLSVTRQRPTGRVSPPAIDTGHAAPRGPV